MTQELIERLRDYRVKEKPLRDEAADALQSQSARIAELEGAGTKLLSAWDDSNWDEDVRQAIRDFRASLTKDSTSGGRDATA